MGSKATIVEGQVTITNGEKLVDSHFLPHWRDHMELS